MDEESGRENEGIEGGKKRARGRKRDTGGDVQESEAKVKV
jgi:hypothetical protein